MSEQRRCQVRDCYRPAALMIEPGLDVCRMHDTSGIDRRYQCKFCAIPINGPEDTSPRMLPTMSSAGLIGHREGCPRRDEATP